MSEHDTQARFQNLPGTVRDKVDDAMSDAKVAFKVKVGELLVNRVVDVDLHLQAPAGTSSSGRRSKRWMMLFVAQAGSPAGTIRSTRSRRALRID